MQEAVARLSALGTITGEQVDLQDLQAGINATNREIARLQQTLATLRAQPQTPVTERKIAALTARIANLQRGTADTDALLKTLRGHSLPDLVFSLVPPGESLRIAAASGMKAEEVRAIELQGRSIFVPSLAINLAYDWGEDGEGRTSKSWLVGRKAAALEDFRYSAPMRRANLTWDDTNLRAYISDPQATVKGNRMPFGGVREAKDVDDIVAYLKTLN